jgi:hypothetical protein
MGTNPYDEDGNGLRSGRRRKLVQTVLAACAAAVGTREPLARSCGKGFFLPRPPSPPRRPASRCRLAASLTNRGMARSAMAARCPTSRCRRFMFSEMLKAGGSSPT